MIETEGKMFLILQGYGKLSVFNTCQNLKSTQYDYLGFTFPMFYE